MIDLQELSRRLVPEKTVLFLGAGASAPSGAPLAGALATQLAQALTGKPPSSDDLMELSGILEMKVGRPALVQELRKILSSVIPTGGLLSLPYYPWKCIYTTNFDTLVEKAYSSAKTPITVIRSNYDYRNADGPAEVALFKLHGCITQDLVDGHKARLVLTERDYEEYAHYRQVLFSRLQLDLAAKDVLMVGYSLRDAHLRNAVKHAAELKRDAGAPGNIFVLVYDRDEDRAALLESNGVTVIFGGIDDLLASLEPRSALPPPLTFTLGEIESQLSPSLIPRVVNVTHAVGLTPTLDRLYAGAAASYADIQHNLTFERSAERRLMLALKTDKLCIALIGVAGVGKTTLARRLAFAAHQAGMSAWELKFGMQLDPKHWLDLATRLSGSALPSVLVIDDCTTQQRQVNLLVDGLAQLDQPRLRLILTAQTSQWEPRTKSPRLFRHGIVEELGRLDEREVDSLLDLVHQTPEVRRLVDKNFLEKSRQQKVQAIRIRCSADMFVALKYLFSTDSLDTILLREYAELKEELQDVYRVVAGLEAAGARVHRQLVIRLLSVRADLLQSYLAILGGLVEEFDIAPERGLYGWKTRHEVVAGVIAKYKLADEKQLVRLLEDIIEALNPTLFLERSTVSSLCLSEYGIQRLESPHQRQMLYEKIIEVAPSERVPRHRLVRELLDVGRLSDAELAIADAVKAVGLDAPLRRYKVLLLVARATDTEGIMLEDRLALLAEARRAALASIALSPEDKYSYTTFARVGQAKYDVAGALDVLDEAIDTMRQGCTLVLDPELRRSLDGWERRRLPLRAKTI
jgi:hypothetical protein